MPVPASNLPSNLPSAISGGSQYDGFIGQIRFRYGNSILTGFAHILHIAPNAETKRLGCRKETTGLPLTKSIGRIENGLGKPDRGGIKMNLHLNMINDVVGYIEDNISDALTLQSIAAQFNLSEFHFSRLFKTITGTSLKQYILGRKLTVALAIIKSTNERVIDIAFDLGFEYPEVFSRAFKKQFGISPSSYRHGNHQVVDTPRVSIIERDIRNYGGVLTLKESYTFLDAFDLYGKYIEVDENDPRFEDDLKSNGMISIWKSANTKLGGRITSMPS